MPNALNRFGPPDPVYRRGDSVISSFAALEANKSVEIQQAQTDDARIGSLARLHSKPMEEHPRPVRSFTMSNSGTFGSIAPQGHRPKVQCHSLQF